MKGKKLRKSLKSRKKKKQTSTLKPFIDRHFKEKQEVEEIEKLIFEILKKQTRKK